MKGCIPPLEIDMPAQPKTRLEELTERMNTLLDAQDRNPFLLRQIRREIDALMPERPAQAYELLGMLATLSENESEMRAAFENALRLESRNTAILANFSTSLSRLGLASEARSWSEKAHRLLPSSLALLDKLIDATVRCGRFSAAAALLDTRAALSPESQHADANLIIRCADYLAQVEISDDEAEGFFSLGFQIVHDQRIFGFNVETGLLSDEETQWMSRRVQIRRPVDEVMQLNDLLVETIVSSDFPATLKSDLVLMFVPATQDGNHAK